MPYRRLPNTDASRIRALQKAYQMGKETPPFKLAYSQKLYVRLQAFLPNFENKLQVNKQLQNKQSEEVRNYHQVMRRARLYLSHFVKVLNMSISRGELPAGARKYFGLEANEGSLPLMNTEKELIYWGEKIIEGEVTRTRKGVAPITNPTIAVVKVHFEKFLEAHRFQRTIQKRLQDQSEEIKSLREEADQLIQQLWNEIESYFRELPEEKRRQAAEAYGLVYVFRKNEMEQQRLIS